MVSYAFAAWYRTDSNENTARQMALPGGVRLSKKADAFSAKGMLATLAPRKVFFRRTRRRKNDLIFFRRLRAAYPQGAGRIRTAA